MTNTTDKLPAGMVFLGMGLGAEQMAMCRLGSCDWMSQPSAARAQLLGAAQDHYGQKHDPKRGER